MKRKLEEASKQEAKILKRDIKVGEEGGGLSLTITGKLSAVRRYPLIIITVRCRARVC